MLKFEEKMRGKIENLRPDPFYPSQWWHIKISAEHLRTKQKYRRLL